ncbi:hypothetical protein CI109_107085 [Kwoniella shandongensis]|uniref:Uncharacterized protein n=1 Tax=Kwoniella shandongensis TaxID=1734106 RepID=A0A5M6BQQ3_9TREE|nr:uncharacterized protein CI109_006493 [Kwoniella shandongensis]KAA5525224.1 hypothetical protein CI109_006493 [Kwoniella shandongensis]
MTSNDRLEKGDTILVTGATGLIGSATVNALISRGYKVRGVTRDVSKTKPLTDKIDNLYGPGKIEFVETGDYAQPDAYKAALEGTAGIVHLAVDLGALFAPDASVDAAIRSATDMTLGLLKTATKIPTMKAVVVTSSNAALYTIEYGKDLDVSLDDYNEASVTNAYAAPLDHPFRATYVYSAAKTRSEQALWKWFRETKPSFSLNTVIPHMVVGKPFNPAPGVYTTSTWLEQLFNGDVNSPIVGFLNPPNWTIDVNDCAVIHVAALLDRDTDGQRLWAAGNPPVHINEILNIWRDAYPNHPIPADFDFPAGSKQILDREASTALLKRYAGKDWTPLKDSLIENVKDLARA